MTSSLKENTQFLLSLTKLLGIIIGVIAIVSFFIYQTQGLPPRVDKLESDLSATKQELKIEINSLKSQIDKSSVKQDIMLEDLKLIKVHILNDK